MSLAAKTKTLPDASRATKPLPDVARCSGLTQEYTARKEKRKEKKGEGKRRRGQERKKNTLEKRKLRGARHFIGTP